MAKKQNFNLDQFDFDRSLDMPDFNFEASIPKNDGKPVTRVIKGAGKGFLDRLTSSSFIRNTLTAALPRGYGTALEFADTSARSIKDLYDSSVREIKPQLNEMARITGRIIPKDATKDNDLVKRLRRFAGTYEDPRKKTAVDPREGNIAAVLGEVFDAQQQMEDRRTRVDDVKDRLREGLTQARHQDVVAQLDAIRMAVTRQAAYTTSMNANYQRRSLEIQYRHYFLAMDQLVETKRANAITIASLEGILRNTALPEQAKLAAVKDQAGLMRNRYLNRALAGVLDKKRDFAAKLRDSLIKQGQTRVKGFVSGLQQGISATDMALDTADMMSSFGNEFDPLEEAGGFAGGIAADEFGRRVARRLAPHIRKIPGVEKWGNKLQFGSENSYQLLQDWAGGKKGNNIPLVGGLVQFLKSGIRGMAGTERGLNKDTIGSATEPAIFDRTVSKSITQIIPGYLARIYRELEVMRTGNTKTELTEYNFSSNKFVSKSASRSTYFDQLVPKQAKDWTTSDINRMIDQIGGKGLTPEQRKDLGQQLLRQNVRGKGATPTRMKDAATWDGPHASTYAGLFKSYYADDKNDEKMYGMSTLFNNLGRYVPESRALIQQLANMGQLEALQEMGIVDEKGENIDLEKYYSLFYGGEYAPGVEGVGGKGGKFKMRDRRPKGPRPGGAGGAMRWQHERANRPRRPNLATQDFSIETPLPPHVAEHDPLIQAIEAHSSKPEAIKILEVLNKIHEEVLKGLPVINLAEGMEEAMDKIRAGIGHARGKAGEFGAQVRDTMVGQRTIWGHAKHYGGKLFGMGASVVNDTRENIETGKGILKPWLKTAGIWSQEKAKATAERYRGWRDVYVKGQALPALRAAKLKAGMYRDAKTGKVLEKWSDITGAVEDWSDGKPELVMDSVQAKTAFVKELAGEKLIKAFGAAVTFGIGIGQDFMNAGGVIKRGAMQLGRAILDELDGPADVYLKGATDKDPLLLASVMKVGGYKGKKSGKPIKKPSDIDGIVEDDKGNVKVTIEQIKTGLVDKSGKPFKALSAKVAEILTNLTGGGVKMWASAIVGGIDLAKKIGRGARDFFQGMLGKDGGILFSGSHKIIDELQLIRQILDDRLKRNPHKRKGSVEDMRAAREEKKAEEAETARGEAKAKRTGLGGMLSTLLGKLKGKRGDKDEDAKGEKDDAGGSGINVDLPDRAKTRAERAAAKRAERAAARRAAKLGRMGKLGRGVGRLARGLGTVGGTLGRTALSLGSGFLGLDAGISAGAIAEGALALGSGAASIGGSLLTGAGVVGGGLLTAIGALASAPITVPLLVAAGVAAGVGAAGYYGYKRFTRDDLQTFDKARYVQYGFSAKDTQYVHLVKQLEELIKPGIVFQNKIAVINDKKVDFKAALQAFDIDMDNKQALNNWIAWFAKRFKPVYLTAVSAANNAHAGVDLSDVDDKLTNDEKRTYWGIAKYPVGPYGEIGSPISSLDALPSGPEEVKAIIAETDKIVEKLPKDQKKDSREMSAMEMAAMGPEGAAAMMMAQGMQDSLGTGKTTELDPKMVTNLTADNKGTGMADSRGTIFVTANAAAINQGWNGKVDALSAIRFKTYGLKEMDQDKIGALAKLEALIAPDVSFTGKGIAQWKGNVQDMLAKAGAAFGITGGAQNTNAYNWVGWFNLRFLPTYLNYRTALKTATGKEDPDQGFVSLKPAQSVNVAQAVYTTTSVWNGQVTSVWKLPGSPWPDYTLNTEVATTDGNLKGLKDEAKTDKLAEDAAYSSKATDANAKQEYNEPTSIWGKIFGTTSDGNKQGTGIMGFLQRAATAVGAAEYNQGAAMTGGFMVDASGKPMGGTIDNMPQASGKGMAAMKDIIYAAAKMAGVDPKLLMSIAAIESGFDPGVKAGTSSATGLFQFIASTWKTMLQKYGAKYNISPNTPPTDARANALMGAEFIKENVAALKGVKANLTDTDVYLAHFLGAGGAKKLLSANPQADATQLMPDAARANASIFYENGRPRTVAQVYAEINRRVRAKGAQFGLGTSDGSESFAGGAANLAAAREAAGMTPPVDPGQPGAAGTAPGTSPGAATTGAPGDMGPPKSAMGGTPKFVKADATQVVPTNPQGEAAPQSGGTIAPGAGRPTVPVVPVANAAPGANKPTQLANLPNGLVGDNRSAGFSPTQAVNLKAQADYQNNQAMAALAGVPDILTQHLDVSRKSLDALNTLVKVAVANATGGSGGTTTQPTADNPTATPPNQQIATKMPASPVSLRRRQFN